MKTMKNLITFHLLLFTPFLILYVVFKGGYINANAFLLLFFIIAFVYRPLPLAYRMIYLELLNPKDWWKTFMPFNFFTINYFWEIFFKVNKK
jgi:hypothetical protein